MPSVTGGSAAVSGGAVSALAAADDGCDVVCPAPEPQPVEAPVLGAPLAVNLNGRQVSLPAKPSGEPHYLVDALQHSGLDFDNLHQPVELLVNGQPGQFSQTLRKDDEVIIRYQDAERE